jgi:hypothetical protein
MVNFNLIFQKISADAGKLNEHPISQTIHD